MRKLLPVTWQVAKRLERAQGSGDRSIELILNAEAIGLFLSGLGLGSVLSSVISYYLLNQRAEQRERLFNKRKEAFVGILTAYLDLGQGAT